MTRYVLRLPDRQHEAVRQVAERLGISMADAHRLAINDWLDDHDVTAPVRQPEPEAA